MTTELRRIKVTRERSDSPGRIVHQRLVIFPQGVVEFRWHVDNGGEPDYEDLATHSREATYPGKKDDGLCQHLMAPCFYDGTSLGAQRMLVHVGDDERIFRELEKIGRGLWEEKAGHLSIIDAVCAARAVGGEV